ncbi:hypothetical protein [Streptomyces sp. NBC_00893]|uniref:hypothetical protein n=1 Tax=Streptomyces sp. NBC_00893 TaxID=2975862 RepID=UPI00224C7FAA|nr:hypothetical protein [Streptomyces sp. NBC_00893]MCX4852062.1 hypothetical protein [Streptomyces sp. NBC_00893]
MAGKFAFLKEEFLIDGAWGGLDLDAPVRHLRAGIGSGGSTISETAFAALGATSVVLTPVIVEQCDAIRVEFATDEGVWTATLDLATQQVIFLNKTTGEVEQPLPVRPEAGERAAGSFSLERMGIPAMETPRGNVTIDTVLVLVYLQQHHAGRNTFGSVSVTDMNLTLEVCFGLLDEAAAHLKAQAKAARSRATRDATALRKASEQRQKYGLPTSFDLDMEQERHGKAADQHAADRLRLAQELEHHQGVLTTRDAEAARRLQAVSSAAAAADQAHQALALLYERRGLARQRRTAAEEAARPRTHCFECEQSLQARSGEGPLCPVCRQPDPGIPARQTQRTQELARAKEAATEADTALSGGQQSAQKAVEARRKAEQDAQRLAARAAAYRTQEITPREAAQARASAGESEARAKLEAVKARRQELVQIVELEKKEAASSQQADDVTKAWAVAEGNAQEHRKQTVKQLSQIFADIAIPMAPDKIRSASIDPKTLAPKINNRTLKQLARSAGLVSIAHTAYHLMALEAARSMPFVLLPRCQWLDAPLDGLGGGPEGERLANAVLTVCAENASSDSQIVLTTPQALPVSPQGLHSTEHDSTRPLIPHARPESDGL